MLANRTNREARAAVIRDLDAKIQQIMERGSRTRKPATDEEAMVAVERRAPLSINVTGIVVDEFGWEIHGDIEDA